MLFLSFSLSLFLSFPLISQSTGMGEFMGTNFLRDDPVHCLDAVGFAREYHTWRVVELCSPQSEGINGLDCQEGARDFATGQNKYYFNPSSGNATSIPSFDAFYAQVGASGTAHYPAAEGIILDVGYSSCPNQDDGVPIYPKDTADPNSPESYAWHADFCTQYVNKYGNGGGVAALPENLKIGEPGANEPVGLGFVQYFENYNEHNKYWECPQEYPGYPDGTQFLPSVYAAMSSADYDGHEGAVTALNASSDSYPVGIKNSDPDIQMVMSGMTDYKDANIDYILEVKSWLEANRGDNKFVFDVINLHHYSFSEYPIGSRRIHGISPEEDNMYADMKHARERIHAEIGSDKELWLTEFGYDSHPFSDISALPDLTVELDGTPVALRDASSTITFTVNGIQYTDNILTFKKWWGADGAGTTGERQLIHDIVNETQADWVARGYLIAAAAGWDKAFQFFLSDRAADFGPYPGDSNLDPGCYRFEYSGLTLDDLQANAKKTSYFYTRTLNQRLANHEVDYNTAAEGIEIQNPATGLYEPYLFTNFEDAVNGTSCETGQVALLNFDNKFSPNNDTEDIMVVWSPTNCRVEDFPVKIKVPV